MFYNKVYITQDDTERAKTELLYHIACTKQRREELVCCFFDIKNEKMILKVILECLKCLRNMKRDKKITVYVTNEDFQVESLQTEYLFNKYPELKTDDSLTTSEFPYVLIRL